MAQDEDVRNFDKLLNNVKREVYFGLHTLYFIEIIH